MTFDMVGMALMALGVILTSGGMLMWGHVIETRGKRTGKSGKAVESRTAAPR
jgi:hypothetical protein